MKQTANKKTGRLAMMLLVVCAAIGSVIALAVVGRGGAISSENMRNAFKVLMQIYLPLIAVMSGFYFAKPERASRSPDTSIEALVFALLVSTAWVVTPIILVANTEYIEDTLVTLGTLTASVHPVVLGVLSYYFSKSS